MLNQGVWVVAKRRGDKVRYRNTVTGAWDRWVTLPLLHSDSRYGQAKTRLLTLLNA